MRKLTNLLTLLCVCMSVTFAQTKVASGTVTYAEDGDPVAGASIAAKGTSFGTISGSDGRFVLSDIPASATTLVISFIGLETQEVPIGQNLRIEMRELSQALEEVIVLGYGTTRREAKTGSVATVSAEDIAEIPATSVDKMLSGKMAGVQITQSSGQPGSSTSIRIRGTSSINAGNEPLYVVDGIPVMSGNQSELTNTSNAIAMINPNDIESITVLKDAAAASIYGSRAATGVILITTKSGKDGKNKITARARYGFSTLANDNNYGVMNAAELFGYHRQAIINSGRNPDNPTNPVNYYRPYEFLTRPETNWMDHFTRLGQMQNYELNMSGGTSKTKYYSSISYEQNEGVFYGVNLDRFQVRVNIDHEINKYLKTGARINGGYIYQEDVPMQALYYSNPAFAGLTILPWTPAYAEDGKFNSNIPENTNSNPRATAAYDDQWEKHYRFNGNMYLEFKPIDKITIKTTNAAEMLMAEGRRFWSNEAHNYDEGYPVLQTTEVLYRLLTTSNTINYEDMFDKHSIRALFGQEANHTTVWLQYQMSESLNPDIPFHVSGNPDRYAIEDYLAYETLLSYFGILDYNYDSKYYLQASARYDGSSKFGSNNLWGLFYSLGASWNIHHEDFIRPIDFIDLLKLRASYGVNGNNNIANYLQYGTYGSAAYNGISGMRPSTPANPDLSWERNATWNIGVDFRIFKNFSGNIDVYSRKTTDMLLSKAQSSTSGFNTAMQNVGSMRNNGVELQFEANIIDNNDWKWEAGFNLAFNKTKILDLAGDEMMNYADDTRLRHIVGKTMYTFYLLDYYGVNPVNGEALWRTSDGQLTNDSNAAAYIEAGSPEPVYIGGIFTNIGWKGLQLSLVGEFKGGNKVLLVENRYLQSDGNQMTMNQSKSLLNYWKQPGDTGVNPKPVAGNTSNSFTFANTRFLEKGDFFRIKDVTLSYWLPSNILKKTPISSAKVYASGLNVFTFHDVNFWDPERGVTGMGTGIYPVTKTFVMGLEVSF